MGTYSKSAQFIIDNLQRIVKDPKATIGQQLQALSKLDSLRVKGPLPRFHKNPPGKRLRDSRLLGVDAGGPSDGKQAGRDSSGGSGVRSVGVSSPSGSDTDKLLGVDR